MLNKTRKRAGNILKKLGKFSLSNPTHQTLKARRGPLRRGYNTIVGTDRMRARRWAGMKRTGVNVDRGLRRTAKSIGKTITRGTRNSTMLGMRPDASINAIYRRFFDKNKNELSKDYTKLTFSGERNYTIHGLDVSRTVVPVLNANGLSTVTGILVGDVENGLMNKFIKTHNEHRLAVITAENKWGKLGRIAKELLPELNKLTDEYIKQSRDFKKDKYKTLRQETTRAREKTYNKALMNRNSNRNRANSNSELRNTTTRYLKSLNKITKTTKKSSRVIADAGKGKTAISNLELIKNAVKYIQTLKPNNEKGLTPSMIHIQKREILGGLTKAIEDYINIIRHARDVAKDEGEDVSEEQETTWKTQIRLAKEEMTKLRTININANANNISQNNNTEFYTARSDGANFRDDLAAEEEKKEEEKEEKEKKGPRNNVELNLGNGTMTNLIDPNVVLGDRGLQGT